MSVHPSPALLRSESQLEWYASLNPLEHAISSSNKYFRKT